MTIWAVDRGVQIWGHRQSHVLCNKNVFVSCFYPCWKCLRLISQWWFFPRHYSWQLTVNDWTWAVSLITLWATFLVSTIIIGIFTATTKSAAAIKHRTGCNILAKASGNSHLCNFTIHVVACFSVCKLFDRYETFNRLLFTTGISAFFINAGNVLV